MAARILVIEDNEANLELMTYLLEAFGHVALVARDGEEGLAVARAERPDLVICDVQLPRLDGYAVVRLLKGDFALRAIPVLAVTAYAMVGDRGRILAAGFDGHIAKPVVPETFVQQADPDLHDVPVVMISATGQFGLSEARSRALGATVFLRAPIEASALAIALERLVPRVPE